MKSKVSAIHIVNGILLLLSAIGLVITGLKSLYDIDFIQPFYITTLIFVGLYLMIQAGIKSVSAMISNLRHPTWRSVLHLISLVAGTACIFVAIAIMIGGFSTIIDKFAGYAITIGFFAGIASILEAIEDWIPKRR